MKRDRPKNRVQALTAISLWLGIFLLAIWLVCMGCMTLAAALFVSEQIRANGVEFSEYVYRVGLFDYLYSQDAYLESRREIPGVMVYSMNKAMAESGASLIAPSYKNYPKTEMPPWINLLQGGARCETAILFVNQDGDILRQSGDFLYFGYVTEADWLAGSDTAAACGWMDLEGAPQERYRLLYAMQETTFSLWDLAGMRMTGYFADSEFVPFSMDILRRESYHDALDAAYPQDSDGETPQYTVSQLDAMGLLQWETVFDDTASADRELGTIYAVDLGMGQYKPQGAVTDGSGREYDNLLAMLQSTVQDDPSQWYRIDSEHSKFHLWDMVIFDFRNVLDLSQYDAAAGDPLPDVEFTILTALRASPLRIAMGYLKHVYFYTAVLALLGFWLVRRSIRKRIIEPVQMVNRAVEEGWQPLPEDWEERRKWAEPQTLMEHYAVTRDTMRSNQNEIARLSTALDFAHKAEEHRRQMTSNIAHELKTPLAVIHSYAEGLKEHVAEEKRDKYLDVILSEAERTDAMVLEMLDLSRLEAGKVKLSRDDFSLIALTRSIFEKLELAVEARKLRVSFHVPEDFTMTADESRMAQVIENFATNAIKYTPVGGQVKVTIQKHRGQVLFYMENESQPLSQTALEKVWDTFYRTDAARNGGGTGLGLAIAKSIIEFHGGKCFVRNTALGVEFGFTI